jgi:hypothetical protein
MPIAFHTLMMNVYETFNDVLIRSPLLFVHGATHVKNIRVERDVNQEPYAFLYTMLCV